MLRPESLSADSYLSRTADDDVEFMLRLFESLALLRLLKLARCGAAGCEPWSAALGHSLGAQPWDTALGHSLGAQPWDTALGHSLGARPWGTALGRGLGARPWDTALGHSLGAQPWGTALGHSLVLVHTPFGAQPWGAALGHTLMISSCGGGSAERRRRLVARRRRWAARRPLYRTTYQARHLASCPCVVRAVHSVQCRGTLRMASAAALVVYVDGARRVRRSQVLRRGTVARARDGQGRDAAAGTHVHARHHGHLLLGHTRRSR